MTLEISRYAGRLSRDRHPRPRYQSRDAIFGPKLATMEH